jgi:hypothetical protein
MATHELTISIPASLAGEAEKVGLLQPSEFERMLREEVRRRQADKFFELADRLAAQGVPPMTAEEIEAEIAAARRERRAADARSR